MAEKKVYARGENGCLYETMRKEEILFAIEEAVRTGEIKDVDTGFITKVKAINKNDYITFWYGTRAEYNALDKRDPNCLYIITNDDTYETLLRAIESTEKIDAHNNSPEAHSTLFNKKVNKPTKITKTTSSVDITLEDNCEYDIRNVSSLTLTSLAAGRAHGFILFSSSPVITLNGFRGVGGGNITEAMSNTYWEFDVCDGYVVWKNWGVK